MGFHGTNGSFGMVGGEIALPGGYTIGYPFGRSVDRYGVVQIDSRNGIGGVAPYERVPMTLANVLAYAGGVDVELQYAVDYLDGLPARRRRSPCSRSWCRPASRRRRRVWLSEIEERPPARPRAISPAPASASTRRRARAGRGSRAAESPRRGPRWCSASAGCRCRSG